MKKCYSCGSCALSVLFLVNLIYIEENIFNEIPTELEMTEQKTTGHISASSQSSIAALKDVLADGRLTQRGGGLNFVDFIFRGIE